MRVLVIGGSGVVGRPTASELVKRGHQVAVLSRSGTGGPPGTEAFAGDLTTGEGIEKALAGVDSVVDCANVRTGSAKKAVAYFTETTHRLGEMAHRAGVRHHVVLSIVGVDEVPFPYYAGKVAQEQTLAAGPVPWSILRATQFHEFAGQVLDQLKLGPLSVVPDMRVQPLAAAEVATALADLVEAGPSGRVADVGGPSVERLPDLARRLVRRQGTRRWVLAARMPGAMGKAMRGTAQLPKADASLRGPSFTAWLETHPR